MLHYQEKRGDDGLVLGVQMAAEALYEQFSKVIKDYFCIVFSDEEHVLCKIDILKIQQREGNDNFKFHGVASTLVWFANGKIEGDFVEFLFCFESFSDKEVKIDIIDEVKKKDNIILTQSYGFS